MKHTYLFLFALCITACSKPVAAPVPDLPLPLPETSVSVPATADAPKPDMSEGSTGDTTGATETPDAAPIFPASPPAINVAVQTAK